MYTCIYTLLHAYSLVFWLYLDVWADATLNQLARGLYKRGL